MYDLIIIGGGPAGTSAGVYAARKKMKTLLIAEDFGGQSIVSETINNWIGSPEIAGSQLAKDLKSHLDYYHDGDILTLVSGVRVTAVENHNDATFTVIDSKNQLISS